MAFSSSTVSIGANTKKSDYDRLLDNTQYLKAEDVNEKKTFQSGTVFNATATFNLGVIRTLSGIETLSSGTSWVVPDNIYRVKGTIIGGGGGGAQPSTNPGVDGSSTTFNGVTALGGYGGKTSGGSAVGYDATNGLVSGNGGMGGSINISDASTGHPGLGGQIKVQLFSVTPLDNIAYSIGSGGAGGGGGTTGGGAGGDGQVILEY